MKKNLIVLLLMGLMLASCSGMAGAEASSSTSGVTVATGEEADALPETTQLMVGTMLLEGTSQAVDAAQAGTLLTLWKAYRSLLNSETSAGAELEAVIEQIKEEMTPEQFAAIEAMQLTNANMQEKLAEAGLDFGGGFGFDPDISREEMQATREALQASGQVPEGMGPGGNRQGSESLPGGVPLGGEGIPMGGVNPEDMDPEQLATLQAQRGSRGAGQAADQFLITMVINFLEGKAAAE